MRVPKYGHHQSSDRARVRINGKTIWLGKYGSPDSKRRYREAISQWRAERNANTSGLKPDITIAQLVEIYLADHVASHYRKNGEPTSEVSCITSAMRVLADICGKLNAADFGPLALKKVRDQMVVEGWERKSINKQVGRIRRLFKWAAAQEMIRVEIYSALMTVSGLQKGRCSAVESEPVEPVPQEHINVVRLQVTTPVLALINLQLACGCRPGEATMMRGCDLTMAEDLWEYRPVEHKTEHHGRGRVIYLGPKAQQVVREFLRADLTAYLFSPKLARGANCRARDRYDCDSYRRAIRRVCLRYKIPIWSPNQLRHNAGTEIRRQYGLEAAQVILGHSKADVTQVYAERDATLAREVMLNLG